MNNQSNLALIIDDDKWITRILEKKLQILGFDVACAKDPYDGVAEAVKLTPKIIFLDIVIPEVSGEVLLKMLKRIDRTKNIPVVLISGNFEEDLVKKTHLEGAAEFISKPFEQEVIAEKLSKVFGDDISLVIK